MGKFNGSAALRSDFYPTVFAFMRNQKRRKYEIDTCSAWLRAIRLIGTSVSMTMVCINRSEMCRVICGSSTEHEHLTPLLIFK